MAPLPTCAHRGMGKVLHLGVLLLFFLFPFFLQQTCAIRQDVQNASQQSQWTRPSDGVRRGNCCWIDKSLHQCQNRIWLQSFWFHTLKKKKKRVGWGHGQTAWIPKHQGQTDLLQQAADTHSQPLLPWLRLVTALNGSWTGSFALSSTFWLKEECFQSGWDGKN